VAGPDEPPLRSPHNIYMTVLARMGVPGALMFVALQAAFALSLLRGYRRARRRGALWWARIDLWLLSYWCAFLVNAAFDVFLEGPQGGIWFWCLMGVAIGALECQRREDVGTNSLRVAA
jgi:O-antigen ligase